MKTMNKNFQNLESDLIIIRNTNYLLLKKVVDTE